MKRRCSILLLLAGLMLMAGCHSPEAKVPTPVEGPTESLCTVDSLMWRQPDSAFALLVDFAGSPNADSLDAFNSHYFHLLLSELLYKNDYAQSNRPELRQAVAYFDSLTLSVNDKRRPPRPHRGLNPRFQNLSDFLFFLDARSHYINGVGYYEQDSVVEACKEYLEALEEMEVRFYETHLVSIIQAHLSALFSDQYLHEQAIYFGHLCLSSYQKYEANPWHKGWVLNVIGSNYDILDELDSAEYYYKEAIEILDDTSMLLYRDVTAHLALLKYKKDNQQTNEAINSLFHSLSTSESEQETISRYSYIGEILYHEKQFDSAWMFLNLVFQESANIGLKKQSAERLVEICKAQNKAESILEYADYLVPFANQEENRSEIKSQLTELYKTYLQEKQERQHQEKTRKHITQTVIVVAGLLFVILIVSFLYHRNRQHKHNLETLIVQERHAHKIQQAALSGRLKKSNEELRELRGQIRRRDDLVTNTERVESFSEEPVCRLIMERVRDGQFKAQIDYKIYKDYALDNEQVLALREAADHHFKQFTARLARAYPALTKSDFDYCCLYLLGLSDADVSALMQRAYNTVSERSRKLKGVFGVKEPLSVMLRSFADESLQN